MYVDRVVFCCDHGDQLYRSRGSTLAAATQKSVAQLARECKSAPESVWSTESHVIEFSIPAEQLAALVIQAAKAKG